MKTAIQEKAVSVKSHIYRNRAKYAAAATFVVCFAVIRRSATQWEAFLVEKGIDPMEFYCPERFEELNS